MPLEHDIETEEREKREKRIFLAYKALFNSEEGQIVLSHLVSFCDVFRTSREAHEPDLAFHDGIREVGLMILRNSGKLDQMRETMGV